MDFFFAFRIPAILTTLQHLNTTFVMIHMKSTNSGQVDRSGLVVMARELEAFHTYNILYTVLY